MRLSKQQVEDRLTAAWIWNSLAFEPYDPAHDEDYLLAVGIDVEHALTSSSPDEVLGSLRSLTRWMEILGEGDMAQWIRVLIRSEAPGTWYVDKYDRHGVVRTVQLSEELTKRLAPIYARIKTEARNRLVEVIQGEGTLDHSVPLLEY